ncbi:hypothetical protein PV341_04895 [Streptomyces sp. PA03-1a]|nr:hypothetical protein [Streptomyces sp. PA03-1a]MDX2815006.1 hypothetical protein [Streptomyces sp. PA03-5A]
MTPQDPAPQVNHGIVIAGYARVSDSALAAGRGSSARKDGTDAEALRAALAAIGELRRRLDALEGAEAAGEEAGALADDLTAEEVDGRRVGERLTRLRALVGDATALSGLVTAVHESVRAITGG